MLDDDVLLGAQEAGGQAEMLPPLRVCLVISDVRAPAWWDTLVAGLLSTPDAELIGYHLAPVLPQPSGPRLARWMLRFYHRVDGSLFGRPNDPTNLVDLSATLAEVPRIERIDGGDALDVVIALGRTREGPWSSVRPSFGVWSFQHDSDTFALEAPLGHALPPGGDEMLRGAPSTTTLLVADLGPDGDRRVLGRVVSRVDRLSMRRGSRGQLRKLPPLAIRALHALRLDASIPDVVADAAPARSTRIELSSGRVASALARAVAGFVTRRISRTILPSKWVVGVTRAADPNAMKQLDFRGLHLLEAPAGREWADPFPIALAGRDLVFVEEYVRSVGRGRLAVVELDDSERGWRSVQTILETQGHLSYPFVFAWNGSWYLMPEQASTGSLEIYQAASFPGEWRWHSTALSGIPASDPTLVEIEGRWWLFAAVSVPGANAADELHLFHATSAIGPWTPHDRNPVVSDIRTARPAGRIFEHDGRWFRPAQDGELGYGHSIVINEIEEISPARYRERAVSTIGPDWRPGLIATHTVNFDAHLAALDGRLRESRFRRQRRPPGAPASPRVGDRDLR